MNARAYLLGTLDAERCRAIEQEMLASDQSYELLLAAEDELIDEYVRGELSGEERARFARVFLDDPARRERVHLAATLAAAATPPRRRWPLAAAALAACAAAALLLAPSPRPAIVEVALAAPTRSAELTELTVPPGARTIRITPTLPAGVEPSGLRLRLRQLGAGNVPGREAGAAWLVEAEDLPDGRYELELARDGRPLGFYRFTVRR